MKKVTILTLLAAAFCSGSALAQIDSSLFRGTTPASSGPGLTMDAITQRPFLNTGKFPVSIGGYIETNWQHLGSGGVSAGDEFQFRRLSLFVASTVAKRIKFLSEIEFENELEADEGGLEVDLEYAAVDVEFNPLFNLRGGIVVNPIGAFNQNHDGPKWEFTDRPIAMTQMLPATWNNSGVGIFGRRYSRSWMFGYEIYLTGGLDNTIIANDRNRTFLPEARENPRRFVSSNSGSPLLTGKLSLRNTKVGELGISYMGGIYNQWQEEGVVIDNKRRCDVLDLDFNTTIAPVGTCLTAEWAWVFVQLPADYSQQFGTRQQGGFMDIVQPLLHRKIFGWENAEFNLACRLEYVDWNKGKFRETGGNIYDNLWSIMPGLSFRPAPETVLRFNYRYQQQRDLFGNPPASTAGFILGLSTYF